MELIEAGDLHSPALRQLLQGYVTPLLAAGCDTLILGCTHYPFLKPLLKEMVAADISLIDTGAPWLASFSACWRNGCYWPKGLPVKLSSGAAVILRT